MNPAQFLDLNTLHILLITVIEKYTKGTRFALICNHVNKIIPALQSRCTRFRFAPLDAVHVTERLRHVINAERYVSFSIIIQSAVVSFSQKMSFAALHNYILILSRNLSVRISNCFVVLVGDVHIECHFCDNKVNETFIA
jgi:hypothetical protein